MQHELVVSLDLGAYVLLLGKSVAGAMCEYLVVGIAILISLCQ